VIHGGGERASREAGSSQPSPTANRSNGGKEGGQGDAAGCDVGKKVKARKIQAPVDTEPPLMRVVVHTAAVQDHDGTKLHALQDPLGVGWLELIWADVGYSA
jgi:putative transposase